MLTRFWPVLVFLSALPSIGQLPPIRSTLYDGSGSMITRYGSEVFAPSLSMTVEAWVYREDASRCETIISQDYRTSFWLGFCGNSLRFYRNGGNFVDADRNVPARRWTHVAAVYDSGPGEVRFYIDGALVATKARSAAFTAVNAPLYLGMTPAVTFGTTYPFSGRLDEVRLWSVARSAAQINSNRFVQLPNSENLVASFSEGGGRDSAVGRLPNANVGTSPQVFGILPRNLVIPKRPLLDAVDGDVTSVEYAGSEIMPVRYLEGSNEVDAMALINAYVTGGGIAYIYVGLTGLLPQGDVGKDNGSSFSWSYGVADADMHVPTSNDRKVTAFYNETPNRFFIGNGSTFVTDPAPGATIVENFCAGDVSPICIEMRSSIPNVSPRAMMLDFLWLGSLPILDRRFLSPMDAAPNDPTTWPQFTIGQTVGGSERVTFNARVQEFLAVGTPAVPIEGARVRLIHGTSLDEIVAGTTRADGTVTLTATVRTNTPLTVELDAPTYWPRLGTAGAPGTGTLPTTTTGGSARFAACTGCDYADVVFTTRAIPAEETTFSGITPTEGHFRRTIIRESPLLELPPSQITILGTNLHMSAEVYLTTCDRPVFSDTSTTPQAATGCNESSFYPVTILSVAPDHRAMQVLLDSATAPQNTGLRILFRDFPSRDGRRQWKYVPGSVNLGEPPFPLTHGFSFRNARDGTQFDEFSGVFQWNAYDCLVPPGFVISPVQSCPGCRIPNPVYLTYYSLMFTGWVELMTGSCLGMSSTALLFARRDLDAASFGTGVRFASGFLGRGADSLDPPKPQEHRFRLCDYSEPVNLWANIHRNQAVQASGTFLRNILDQMSGTGIGTDSYSIAGNPNQALGRIRANLRSYLLCFQNGADFFQSHCVTPYRITDGKGMADDGVTMVDRPDSTIIHVYDSNDPGEVNCLFEVNRTANTFRYAFGFRTRDGVREPVMWSGKGMYATPISIWQNARAMPGFDLLERGLSLLVFGSADGEYTDADGGKWGWDGAGTFRDTYIGAKAIAPSTSRTNAVANQTRGVMFFPPTNRPPASIRVNPRGGKWNFHAAEAGTLAQLEVMSSKDGDQDALSLSLDNGILRGFRFKPQRSTTSIIPTLGLNLGTNPSVAFSWQGILIGDGKAGEFLARHDRAGVQFLNDTGLPNQPTLRMLRGDGDGFKTNVFGPFTVPDGAAQLASVEGSTDADTLRLELDLDRDGRPEAMALVAPGSKEPPQSPELMAIFDGARVQVSWPVNGGAWQVESTLDVGENAKWIPENLSPSLRDGESVVTLEPSEERRFLRLKNAF